MLRKIVGIVILFSVLLGQFVTLQRCANPLPPKGGPKDTIGPQLVSEETTPSFQTNFRPDKIELTFNEWVQIKDPTQILVSPPLEPAPKISLKKKTLTINFGEALLRDSATYVVNIGGAVVDLTESNPPDNLRFVFATGPVLDSASVSGRLVDAYTGEPVEKALFTLYANLADTAARTENPFYFARSDEDGFFEISNIKPGVYRGIALNNGGQSGYKLDERATKAYGFPDSLIVIPGGALKLPDIKVTETPKPLRLISKDTSTFGQINLVFDRPATQVLLRSEADYLRVDEVDTLRLFYTENRADSLFFSSGTTDAIPVDTLVLLPINDELATFSGQPVIKKMPEKNLSPLKMPVFVMSRPLVRVNDSLLQLRKDTFPDLLPVTAALDSQRNNRFELQAKLAEGERYLITLLPGAVADIFGRSNQDTLITDFKVLELVSLGTLNLQLRNFDPEKEYVLRLIRGNDKTPADTLRITGSKDYNRVLPGLSPGNYQMEIIQDENGNGRFDGADYDRGVQPEPVRIFKLEALRADWEVEAIIDLDELPAPVSPQPRSTGDGTKGRRGGPKN